MPVERLATWLARLDDDEDDSTHPRVCADTPL